jgi:pimeloyl-ACP methyl ester carboxylesterase
MATESIAKLPYFQIKRSNALRPPVEYRGGPLRLKLAAALALVALAVVAPSALAAPSLKACSGQDEFGCATLDVPLDRTGAIPGVVPLHYAVQRHGPRPVLIALAGGPGQAGVAAASSYALSLEPALRRYRVAVLDQRGTGESGVLRCPNLQRLRSLDALQPASVAACANRIGARRDLYSTADTVLDIEDLRKTLGVDKIALAGISYGTHVALQYARAFPDHVDRLILDSIVGPDGPNAFMLDTWRNLPRILTEQCARGACRNTTRDPVADVAALVKRLNASGPLRGSSFDERGRRRATEYRNPDELAFLIVAGDLNPYLQASLPAALSAARLGDSSLLMRLRRIGQGAPLATGELSFGLYAAAGCADMSTPYSLLTPFAARGPAVEAAMAAIPVTDYDPFDAATVIRTGNVDDCSQWPVGPVRPPFTGPLPDVPALLLGGRLDTRTPIENAFAAKAELPHASVVTLKGSGHDTMDSDVTGCIALAMQRFIADRAVGHPCVDHDNGVAPTPLPPRGVSDFRSAPGVGGDRGRALFAVLDTAADARLSVLQTLYAGLESRGGGLHGGYYTGGSAIEGRIRLHRYAYVPGLRVSGTVHVVEGELTGTLRVSGRAHGTLKLDHRGGAAGVLGGRQVRYRATRAAQAAALRTDGASILRSIQGPLRRRALR